MPSSSPIILNVNDDLASRYVTSRVLSLAGFQVLEAGTGGETLALADEHTDLVILDVRLPDLSGLEVCRRLKSSPRTRNALVLHLSAQAVGAAERAQGLAHGADAYLVAPVDPEELVAQVHALLRLRRAEREVRELSDQVQQQRRLLDLAMSAAADPIALYDGDGMLIFANHAVAASRGSHHVHVPGRNMDALRTLDPQLEPYALSLEAARRTGQVQRGRVTLSSDQGPRHFEYTMSPAAGPSGAVEAVIATGRDITEVRNAEDFREQFLGILGHDLRNPLNALSMSAQQLQRQGEMTQRQKVFTERILISAERMDRMIRQLLDFARARLGAGLPVVRSRCDLFDVVRGAVDESSASHPHREVRLELLGDGRGDWDADRLEQVVGNLVSNALKFSPPDTPVRVVAEATAKEALLRVHNLGVPIPEDQLPHLFAAWRRAGRSEREQGVSAGLGLGLYITEQIVRAHGGTVQVTSTEAKGTTFTVRLPRG
ncbi:response regulator [Corallococcus sp. CA047B]|uniref:sensor histidine kinase n=1 Tax=Corallococcus sp. CA047B TaxID=2316729 RepID=UPI000EA1DC9E|nr:ATP-binding protein [Corallococcus sp. CA047B]RKH15252.1 response regulator [Corallococcus sp. CA047B]